MYLLLVNIFFHSYFSCFIHLTTIMSNQLTIAPRICSICRREHFDSNYATCELCRVCICFCLFKPASYFFYQAQRNNRYARRQQNESIGRRRTRAVPQPAAYISEVGRLQPSYLGSMNEICADCGAKHWKAELPSQCTSRNNSG